VVQRDTQQFAVTILVPDNASAFSSSHASAGSSGGGFDKRRG
jgi:hypothetical protein